MIFSLSVPTWIIRVTSISSVVLQVFFVPCVRSVLILPPFVYVRRPFTN